MATKAQKSMLAALEALYPDARPELNFRDPYETLVAVMLSAQSTDVQVNKATPALFARYPTVADLASADVAEVFPFVCGHRLILNAKARLNEDTAEQLIESMIGEVKKPDVQEFRK